MNKKQSIDLMVDKYRLFRNRSVDLALETINNKSIDVGTRDAVQSAMELVMDISNDIIDDLQMIKNIHSL